MKMTDGHRSLLASLLLAGPLAVAMHSQTPSAPQSPQQAPAATRTPRPEVAMDPERARALYVSNKPEDLPTCNCERDLENQKEIDATYAARSEGVMTYQKIRYVSSD